MHRHHCVKQTGLLDKTYYLFIIICICCIKYNFHYDASNFEEDEMAYCFQFVRLSCIPCKVVSRMDISYTIRVTALKADKLIICGQ